MKWWENKITAVSYGLPARLLETATGNKESSYQLRPQSGKDFVTKRL
jgi:hypothetical protein